MCSICRLEKTPLRTATPPTKTGRRSSPTPRSARASLWPRSTNRSRSLRTPAALMPASLQPWADSTFSTARIVPLAPMARSQPRVRRVRAMGSSSASAASSAVNMRRELIRPLLKKRSVQPTQPM